MWLGIGYLLPMKGDKAGDSIPPAINLVISENGGVLQMESNTDKMIPELQQ